MQTAAIFQNGMVLQRNKPVVIWGTGLPGERIKAEIQGQMEITEVDSTGKWMLMLPELKTSEDETLILRAVFKAGEEEKQVFYNVAVGEVWVAGGQSNMEFYMRYEKHIKDTVKTCKNPRIRFYDVPKVCYEGQIEEFDYSRMGVWRSADEVNLEYFSAVGYYFEKELERVLDVPVGIIGCNWGGTGACTWMKRESVECVGKPWIEMYEEKISGVNMDEYWRMQHHRAMNDKGNPFASGYSELLMPRTLTEEEMEKLVQSAQSYVGDTPGVIEPFEIPGQLYQFMLKTIAPYGIRGFLWYQGEGDDAPGKQKLYQNMLTALIRDWRELWGDTKLPFLLVQLPGWEKWLPFTSDNVDFMTIRRCQENVTKTVENTYLCSISDAGEQRDIHPKNKKVVGERLALLARGHVYQEKILCDAPTANTVCRDGKWIEITFCHAEGGLKMTGDTVNALHVFEKIKDTGMDLENAQCKRREIPFHAEIQGEKLLIILEEEAGIIDVEFAETKWFLVNLYNQADIPAIPFRCCC